MEPQPQEQSQKRDATHRKSQPQMKSTPTPKKKHKKLKENPFEDLPLNCDDEQPGENKNDEANQWIKPKITPLTITVTDHSKVNKFYSHKSLQKYLKYLLVENCPNPLWLSIKRKSQIQHIIYMDIQIQNNLFYQYITAPQQSTSPQSQLILSFLSRYNKPQCKAIFKQSRFIKQSVQVWDALFVYDLEALKEEAKNYAPVIKELPQKLNSQLFAYYQTFILNEEQRKYNLYPMPQLPAYKDYYSVCSRPIFTQQKQQGQVQESKPNNIQVEDKDRQKDKYHQRPVQNQVQVNQQQQQIPLKNKILIIDCEMVMHDNTFVLARTSIMNFQGELIYDELFKPDVSITNYNTQFSGITQQTLKNVTKKIQNLHHDLSKLITKDTILVGHSLQNDLHAMKFIHDRVIDTSVLYARKNGSKMKLKTLAYQILNRSIQVGSHCSQQDCKATLQLMRQKIQAHQQTPTIQNKTYHLLNELQENNKKIVIIDQNLQFIKHRKQYIGIQFEEVENQPLTEKQLQNQRYKQTKNAYLAKFTKYLDKNVKIPDIIFSMIRKTSITTQSWQDYYRRIDYTIQCLYKNAPDKTVFFLNFQVNNFYQIYPQMETISLFQRKRPFCMFVVKSQ